MTQTAMDMDTKPLPAGWKWVKLGDICEVKGGKRLPKGAKFSDVTTPYQYIRVADFEYRSVNASQVLCITSEVQRSIERYTISSEDVYISIAGTIGVVGRVPPQLDGANLTENAAKLVFGAASSGHQDYIVNYLESSMGRESIGHRTNVVGQPKLAIERIRTIPVPLPPLEEQKRIAAILNGHMAAVEKAKKAAEERLEAAKALPAAYLREVFEGDKIVAALKLQIADISETTSGSTPLRSNSAYYGGQIPWVKTGELKDSTITDISEFVTTQAVKECSLKILPADTVLIAMYGQGQTRGRTGLLSEPATINQACFAILPNASMFNPKYLQMWFRYSYLNLRAISEGRGGTQPNLNGRILKELEIPLPEIAFQDLTVKQFDGFTESTFKAEESIQQELETIESMPAALLRKAFSGEL